MIEVIRFLLVSENSKASLFDKTSFFQSKVVFNGN